MFSDHRFTLTTLLLLTSTACTHQEKTQDASLPRAEAPLIAERNGLFVEATVIERAEPEYPLSAVKRGHEGSVELNFVISKEGKVVDPIITAATGPKSFHRAAIEAIRNWRYQPATLNGEVIEQANASVRLDWYLDGNFGASKYFRKRFKEIQISIAEEKLAQAGDQLDSLERKLSNHYEYAWYWWLRGQTQLGLSDIPGAHYSLSKAITYNHGADFDSGHEVLSAEVYRKAHEQLFMAEVFLKNYSDALAYYETLKELGEVDAAIKDKAQKVRALIDSPQALSLTAEIDDSEAWYYDLNRRAFSVDVKSGRLDKLEVRCQKKRQYFDNTPNTKWTIPASWGACGLLVHGAEGTQFEMVELAI